MCTSFLLTRSSSHPSEVGQGSDAKTGLTPGDRFEGGSKTNAL